MTQNSHSLGGDRNIRHAARAFDENTTSLCLVRFPPVPGRVLSFSREGLDPILGNEQRVLKLSRAAPICRRRCPAILPHDVFVVTFVNHRLNREDMPRGHYPVVLLILVVQDRGVGVEDAPDAVPAKVSGGREPQLHHMILNHTPNLVVANPGLANRDCLFCACGSPERRRSATGLP